MNKFITALMYVKNLILEIITLPILKIKLIILEIKLKKTEQVVQRHNKELEAEYGTSDPHELSAQLVQHEAMINELQIKLKKAEQAVQHHDKELEARNKELEAKYGTSDLNELSELLAQLSVVENEPQSIKNDTEENKEISASEFFDQWRDISEMAEDASLKSVYEKISIEERVFWEKTYNDLQLLADRMLVILKKISSPEALNSLENANAHWNEKIAPLIKNRLYAKIQFEGEWHSNMIDELRADEPGNELLREIIKNDPELLRCLIGEKYAKNLSELLNCDPYIQQYLDKMPEFKISLENYREALVNLEKAEVNAAL